MNKFALILFALIVSLSVQGQNDIESESYGLDQYIEKCSDIPVIRRIKGGTIFKITYEPEDAWNNSMKGAFEYACKIWEEQLPNTLPINICAKIGRVNASGGNILLSKVQARRSALGDAYEYNTRIKYKLLEDYNYYRGLNGGYADSIYNKAFFDLNDIEITYNKNLLEDFSFSLYSTPENKYDFVTVVLRDIAKGLGFISGFTAKNGKFDETSKPLTFYEKKIENAINADNPYEKFYNSTQGSLPLYVSRNWNLNLYAPTTWQNGVSLNYFIPDATHKFTELLTYELGKGTVNRNIVDNYDVLLRELQGWKFDEIPVSNEVKANKVEKEEGNTGDPIDYNGDITIIPSFTRSYAPLNETKTPRVSRAKRREPTDDEFNLEKYLFPFNYRYPDKSENGSWIVSLLKKDGTWDCVFKENTYGLTDAPLEINMSDLDIESDYELYQRTCDGYLRCRITNYYIDCYNGHDYYNIKNYYYVLDYLPQKVKMDFNADDEFNENSSSGVANTRSYIPEDDEYTQEIKINIKDLEGVDRIVVEQLDEGNELPVRYEVPDFKKGYFTAIVDKELYTDFVVCSYNKNGSVRSEIFTVEPLNPYPEYYDIDVYGSSIYLSQKRRYIGTGMTYEIYNTSGKISLLKSGVIEGGDCSVDVADLGTDLYTFKLKYNNTTVQQIKFRKKRMQRR